MAAGVGQEDADLGVLDPTGGAGVLTSDPRGMLALLEESGLIENQDGLVIAEGLNRVDSQVIADLVGIPVGATQEVLDGVGTVVADLLGELPGVLALDRTEQADKIGPDSTSGFAASESRGDPLGDRVELLAPGVDILETDGGCSIGHGDPPWVS